MAVVQETKAPATSVVASRPAEGTGGPRLLGWIREALRAKQYRRRTEQTYCRWVKRFVYGLLIKEPSRFLSGFPGPLIRISQIVFGASNGSV